MRRGHLPLRTCIGCRQVRPKPVLLRLVVAHDGRCTLDSDHRSPGRGYYLCATVDCYQRALKRGPFRDRLDLKDLAFDIESHRDAANSKEN